MSSTSFSGLFSSSGPSSGSGASPDSELSPSVSPEGLSKKTGRENGEGASPHTLIATEIRRAGPKFGEPELGGGAAAERPLYLCGVEAGFPSPADDYVEASLDLRDHLVGSEEATFFVRVAGSSMTEAGIHDGDLLVVDRSVEPEGGDVVVAALDGELTVKRYEVRSGQPYLMPESEAHDPIAIEPGQELVVWGVAQHVIHEVS